jgi:hypothetical protein
VQVILEQHPTARLRVYAVWTSRLPADERSQWDGAGLTDPRVVHLWDERDAVGKWATGPLPGYDGPDWDFYLLFGPDASWGTAPPPPDDSGWSVVRARDDLDSTLTRLLRGG